MYAGGERVSVEKRPGVVYSADAFNVTVLFDDGTNGSYKTSQVSRSSASPTLAARGKYRPGERVTWIDGRGERHFGVFVKGGLSSIVEADTGSKFKVMVFSLRPSLEPLPDHIANRPMPQTLKKGDAVEFDFNGESIKGLVRRGGADMVTVDTLKASFRVPAKDLRSREICPSTEPDHPINDWSLSKYSEVEAASQETVFYTAVINYRGQPVIAARNDGHGGCDHYNALQGIPRRILETFAATTKDWLKIHGHNDETFEPEAQWIRWYSHDRKFGVSGAEFVAEENARYAELLKCDAPKLM